VPVLFPEDGSLFSPADVVVPVNNTPGEANFWSRVKSAILNPLLNGNVRGDYAMSVFCQGVRALSAPCDASVLIIGAGPRMVSRMRLTLPPSAHLVNSDVQLSHETMIIFDAHFVPFANETFDGVVIEAVLEHVLDPAVCVAEIHRVLKTNGVVYASTPFMQQMHMLPYDFQRFTFLGHRRLFRRFKELRAGACCGTGMAFMWASTYFARSLFRSKRWATIAGLCVSWVTCWAKLLDRITIDWPNSLGAASAFYFIGRKSDSILCDRDLVGTYYSSRFGTVHHGCSNLPVVR
jgi:SAM-dependent methyltransferase